MKIRLNRRTLARNLAIAGVFASGISAAGILAVKAQEPRFRLRNIPQRLLGRLPAEKPIVPEARPAETPSSASADNPPVPATPVVGELQRTGEPNSETVRMQSSSPQFQEALQSAAGLKPQAIATPPAKEQPLVIASEAEKSQKIAEDWPEPWACLFVTGRQHGYIEPCGCTGLENQKGGLNRRDTLLTMIRERGWNVVPIDAGDQVRRHGPQAEIKFSNTNESLKQMGYAAVAFGAEELQLQSTNLLVKLTDLQGKFNSHFTSANVSVLTDAAPERFKIISLPSGRKIGITSVLSNEYAKDVPQGEITIKDAVTSLTPVAQKIVAEKCDYKVLIVNGTLEESREIAQKVPLFDLVVTTGGHGEPTYKPEPIAGTPTSIIQVGVKGMYTGLVGLYDDAQEPVRYQRVALSSQFEDSDRMMKLFANYQQILQKAGLKGLGLKPLSHPSNREFVGSKACADCHQDEFDVWENSPHAHATDSIISPPGRGDVPRHFDPECLSCHVTGWNAQQYYPYRTGYLSLEESAHLTGNGCENCHGPGSEHVAYEHGLLEVDDKLEKSLRDEMRLSLDSARDKCLECHDLDNSPAFHNDGAFEKYWKQIEH